MNDSHPIRFLMIGGFLGAGKTTAIGRLAARYRQAGKNVGIVTNDQAADLVDTHTLRSQGFDVGEVAGACFCCNFDELTDTVAALEEGQRPDVILAEPVGSCTDLVATVVQPLKKLFDARFSVAPYGVILKPSHGKRILSGEQSGFSPKAAYIFEKQLEEADVLLLNRVDELPPEEVEALARLLKEKRPDAHVLRISAKTGDGFDALEEFLAQDGDFGTRILDLDYDVYAEGEAELGWLNMSFEATAEAEFALDDALLEIVARLRKDLAEAGAETAHLKTIGLWEGYYGVANLVASSEPPVLSLPSNCSVKDAHVVVNARVAVDPAILQTLVDEAVAATCGMFGLATSNLQSRSFRPGRPVPTHRFSEA